MSEMQYLRLFVEFQSHTVSTQVSYHTVVVFLSMFLYCVTYISDERIRLCRFSSNFEAFLCHSHELLLLRSSLADNEHS